MKMIAGIDIGGTKCAVSLGCADETGTITVLERRAFPTIAEQPYMVLKELAGMLKEMLLKKSDSAISLDAIGISCGGPLDTKKGLVLSPPNLPGWDEIPVVSYFEEAFGVPVKLQNDANACALAEWRWGVGKGCEHMIFLTFGTGMGAGLILNGRLYSGANDMAGEVGHIRMESKGPAGYGKEGSFEGFCSGGGIARLGVMMHEMWMTQGKQTSIQTFDAKGIAEAAENMDELALCIYGKVGTYLGRGIAVLIDILNPECIVIGSIYSRQEALLRDYVLKEIKKEALELNQSVCRIVPAGLGESVGDFAALAVGMDGLAMIS